MSTAHDEAIAIDGLVATEPGEAAEIIPTANYASADIVHFTDAAKLSPEAMASGPTATADQSR